VVLVAVFVLYVVNSGQVKLGYFFCGSLKRGGCCLCWWLSGICVFCDGDTGGG